MVSRRTEQWKLDAGLAVALDPLLDLGGRPACGHSFDIGVRDSLDQAFHAAFSIGLLEDRDIFFPDVRLTNPHLGTCNKRELNGIELSGNFPAPLVERFFVTALHGEIDELSPLEFRPVPARRYSRVLDDL